MRLNTKKGIATFGVVLLTALSAITSKANTSCDFSTSNNFVTAYGSGWINSKNFYYAGWRSKTDVDYSKYRVAGMTVKRTMYNKYYESDRKLTETTYRQTKSADKKDKEGITIILKTYDTNGTKVTSQSMRTVSWK